MNKHLLWTQESKHVYENIYIFQIIDIGKLESERGVKKLRNSCGFEMDIMMMIIMMVMML